MHFRGHGLKKEVVMWLEYKVQFDDKKVGGVIFGQNISEQD